MWTKKNLGNEQICGIFKEILFEDVLTFKVPVGKTKVKSRSVLRVWDQLFNYNI